MLESSTVAESTMRNLLMVISLFIAADLDAIAQAADDVQGALDLNGLKELVARALKGQMIAIRFEEETTGATSQSRWK